MSSNEVESLEDIVMDYESLKAERDHYKMMFEHLRDIMIKCYRGPGYSSFVLIEEWAKAWDVDNLKSID